MQDEDEAEGESDNPKQHNKHGPIAARIIGASLLGIVVLALVARFLPDMKERLRFFTDSALGWLVFVIVAVQTYFSTKQWDAMAQGLEIERAKTDPRLRVAEVRVANFEVGKRPVFIMTIANDGLIAATDVQIHMGVEIDADKELDWVNDPNVTIPARGKETFWIVSNSQLEQQHIAGFNSTVPLKVVGHFTYWPIGRQGFCYKYNAWQGDAALGIPQFVPCDFDPRLNTTLRISGIEAKTSIGAVGVVIHKNPREATKQQKGRDETQLDP